MPTLNVPPSRLTFVPKAPNGWGVPSLSAAWSVAPGAILKVVLLATIVPPPSSPSPRRNVPPLPALCVTLTIAAAPGSVKSLVFITAPPMKSTVTGLPVVVTES